MIGGGPSVLYDAVVLLPSQAAIGDLVKESTARDFVADAFAHCKFIGYVSAAGPLFEKAGIAEADFDEGIIRVGIDQKYCRLCRKPRATQGLGSRTQGQNEIGFG